jgi:hypothetical protein
MEWEARLLLAGRAAVRAEEAAQQLRSRRDAEVVPLRAKLDQPAALTLDEFLAAVAVVEAGTGGAGDARGARGGDARPDDEGDAPLHVQRVAEWYDAVLGGVAVNLVVADDAAEWVAYYARRARAGIPRGNVAHS